jgi:hypothetical protein
MEGAAGFGSPLFWSWNSVRLAWLAPASSTSSAAPSVLFTCHSAYGELVPTPTLTLGSTLMAGYAAASGCATNANPTAATPQ